MASSPLTDVVIKPTTGPLPARLDELWSYRQVFGLLVWRDIKVRYAQTALGGAWMVFQPLALMLVYTFAFSHLAKVSIPGLPYPVFALSGLVLWIFVSRSVLTGSESLLTNIALVTKTACPRILIPLAAVVSVFVDFLVALALFFVIASLYGIYPSWHVVFVPFLLVAAFVLTFGLSLFLSATNVRYRDVAQALPFLIMLWFFLSPVAYQLQTPGHSWQTIVQALNPLVGLILALRWALLDTPAPHGLLALSVVISIGIFLIGLRHFSHAERTLADDI
jgi:lipopolysaccharide transport system permease protein